MKKTFKRLKKNFINRFKHVLSIIFKIGGGFIKSLAVCFLLGIALVIINSIMGIHISFSYYFKLALITTLFSTAGVCLLRIDYVFAKPVKVSRKSVPTATSRKAKRSVQRRKRIS